MLGKTRTELYFINPEALTIFVEVCFVDDTYDYMLYKSDRLDAAMAIVKAVLNHSKEGLL